MLERKGRERGEEEKLKDEKLFTEGEVSELKL